MSRFSSVRVANYGPASGGSSTEDLSDAALKRFKRIQKKHDRARWLLKWCGADIEKAVMSAADDEILGDALADTVHHAVDHRLPIGVRLLGHALHQLRRVLQRWKAHLNGFEQAGGKGARVTVLFIDGEPADGKLSIRGEIRHKGSFAVTSGRTD